MSKFNLSKFFGMGEEDYESTDSTAPKFTTVAATPADTAAARPVEKPRKQQPAAANRQNIVSINTPTTKANKIIVFEPRIYSDAKEVATHLLNNRAVVLSFKRIEQGQAKRIVDFLSGTVFAINGDIQRVGEDIFLCTPANYEIDGGLTEALRQDNFK